MAAKRKYWVTFVKYAGVEIEAESAKEAERKAMDIPEEEYVFPEVTGDSWSIGDAEEMLGEEEY